MEVYSLGIGLFVLNFVGLLAGMYPYIVPRQILIIDALAPASSLNFLLPGVLLLVPVILLFTLYGYRVFSGKVKQEEGGY